MKLQELCRRTGAKPDTSDSIALIKLMAQPKNRKELVQLFVNRINKGVNFLDKKLGRGKWVKNINLSDLELSSPDMCICGQAFAKTIQKLGEDEYSDGFDYVHQELLSDEELNRHGFNIEDEITDQYDWAFDLLTSLWIAKLTKVTR